MAYIPYSNLSDLIAICTYLLLRTYYLTGKATYSIRRLQFFLLISRILTYIFLLLSITITFYTFFDTTNLINGMFLPFMGWLQPLRFPPHSLIHTIYSPSQGFACYYYLDHILVPTHLKYASKRARTFLAIFQFVLDYILILPSLNSISHSNVPFWAYVVIQLICLSLCNLTNVLMSGSWLML